MEQSFSFTVRRLLSIAHVNDIPLPQVSQACESGIGPSLIARIPVHLELSQLEFGRVGVGLSHREALRTLQHVFHNAILPSTENLVWPRSLIAELRELIVEYSEPDWAERAAGIVRKFGVALLLGVHTAEQVKAYALALDSLPCAEALGNREANRMSFTSAFGSKVMNHEPFPSILRDTPLGEFLTEFNLDVPYDEQQFFCYC